MSRRKVWLGLGANLGQPSEQITAARQSIANLPDTQLIAFSSLYRSDPVGPAGQPDYCNAACEIETALEPLALLDALQAIENQAGRKRDGIRWAARLLDIDILHVEDFSCDTPRLKLPHPQLSHRNWVLVPVAEIAPDLSIPGVGNVGLLARVAGTAGMKPWA